MVINLVKCGEVKCSCPVLCWKCRDDANFGDPFRRRCDDCGHMYCRNCISDNTCAYCEILTHLYELMKQYDYIKEEFKLIGERLASTSDSIRALSEDTGRSLIQERYNVLYIIKKQLKKDITMLKNKIICDYVY